MSSSQISATERRRLVFLHRLNAALSSDFCPRANRYIYWLKNPFWILVLATAGSIVCGIMLNPFVFGLTATLVAVTGVGVLLPWISIRGIDCRVSFDIQRTRVGLPVLVRLTVRNRWPMPVWGLSLIRGFAVDTAKDGGEGIALARVPGWSTVEYSWAFEPRQRGMYPNDTAEIETGFPFGLLHARRAAAVDGQLVVWPETARLDGVPDAAESVQTEELYSERRVGEFGDMMGTRPFRNGDSLRRVHWSQTARQQNLIVTERQAPAITSVRLVADLSHSSHAAGRVEQTVDICVTVAASLCESLHRQHARVELVLGDRLFVVGEATAGFNRAMDALATVGVESTRGPFGRTQSQGYEIRVTTTSGVAAGIPHQIVVGPHDDAGSAWIRLDSRDSVINRFPDLWRRSCHVT